MIEESSIKRNIISMSSQKIKIRHNHLTNMMGNIMVLAKKVGFSEEITSETPLGSYV